MTIEVDSRVNVTGVCCPLPLIQLAKAANELRPGQTIEITGDDPIFETAVRDFCTANGHEILEAHAGQNYSITIVLRLGGTA